MWMVPKDWRLEWRQWGGLHVVYNPASGDTHLLNAFSARVLRSLETKASTLEELEALVSDLRHRPSADPPSSDIQALVSELDELGLIAPAHS
jgi:PqqD family protein of HPr-rel-A system